VTDEVLVEEEDGILTVTLNRPEKLNAITREMAGVLRDAVWSLADREDLRVLVITGNGRYFTAGLDISPAAREDREKAEGPPSDSRIVQRRRYRARHHLLFDEIEVVEKPVILAAQGPCLGYGMELASSCDFRFATPEAHFGLPEIKRGVLAGSGGMSRLTRLVGPHWSKWINLAGKNVDAELARTIGFVHEIHPAETFKDEVQAFARELVALAPETIGLGKLAIDLIAPVDREKGRHIDRVSVSALQGIPGKLDFPARDTEKREKKGK
jgi:enoyl-CoA hydratase/carnithine racemase